MFTTRKITSSPTYRLGTLLFLGLWFILSACIAQANPNFIKGPTNHIGSVAVTGCPKPPCAGATVTLKPDPVTYLAPPMAGSSFMYTFIADKNEYSGWTAAPGDPLKGFLTINDYLAVDFGSCVGGATMDATYTRDNDNDPATLTFIQMWYDNYSSGTMGKVINHIDPYPNDDAEPFYYTATERAKWGLQFNDNPRNSCPSCPSFTWNRFDTYLCSWDATNKEVYVHDGWSWGYDLKCTRIPVPSSLILGIIGVMVVRRMKKLRYINQ